MRDEYIMNDISGKYITVPGVVLIFRAWRFIGFTTIQIINNI